MFNNILFLKNSKYSLQSFIINATLIYTNIKTGHGAPGINTAKLDSNNLFSYQTNQIRSSLRINKIKKYEEKNNRLRSYNKIKTTTKKPKKQRKTSNEKNLDQERWIPLRDRTTYKPKSAYLKSKNIKAKAKN